MPFPSQNVAPVQGWVPQVVRHIVAFKHWFARHGVTTGAGQLPAPSQLAALVPEDAEQLASRQLVVAPGKAQAACAWQVPAQRPVPPQLRPVCAAPERKVQVPGVALHTSQGPVQARSQQKLSAQRVPATQPPAVVAQVWPRLLLHTPVASQVPGQFAGSS